MGRTPGTKNITIKKVMEIRRRIIDGEKPPVVAKVSGVGIDTVYRACRFGGGNIRTMLYGSSTI